MNDIWPMGEADEPGMEEALDYGYDCLGQQGPYRSMVPVSTEPNISLAEQLRQKTLYNINGPKRAEEEKKRLRNEWLQARARDMVDNQIIQAIKNQASLGFWSYYHEIPSLENDYPDFMRGYYDKYPWMLCEAIKRYFVGSNLRFKIVTFCGNPQGLRFSWKLPWWKRLFNRSW